MGAGTARYLPTVDERCWLAVNEWQLIAVSAWYSIPELRHLTGIPEAVLQTFFDSHGIKACKRKFYHPVNPIDPSRKRNPGPGQSQAQELLAAIEGGASINELSRGTGITVHQLRRMTVEYGIRVKKPGGQPGETKKVVTPAQDRQMRTAIKQGAPGVHDLMRLAGLGRWVVYRWLAEQRMTLKRTRRRRLPMPPKPRKGGRRQGFRSAATIWAIISLIASGAS